jgi:16S rRNA (guanine(527)-N(7))-methyltransferase RsmG
MFHVEHDLPESFSEAQSQCLLLGVEISDDFHRRTSVFLNLLVECSSRMNLTGPVEKDRLWKRHVLESVAYAPFLGNGTIVDIGSGAGFPGFVLALLGYDVVMVEPRHKRSAFLETAARECGVSALVRSQRIEKAGPFPSGTQFTCRAVSDPLQIIRLVSTASEGDFSLVARVSERAEIGTGSVRYTELPVPPLDRKGIMLQYSHF